MAFDFPNAPSVGTVFSPAGGPSWQWNGQGWVNVLPAGGVIGNIVTTVLLTSGSYVKPAGLRFLEVTLVGPGGAGSRAGVTAANTCSVGGGGGGGGVCISLFAASDLSASEAYTIGAPGVGGQTAGTSGGTSTFKGMTAGGGGGGTALVAASSTFVVSGRGGAGSASGGQINIMGGHGGQGDANGMLAGWGKGGHTGPSFFALSLSTAYTSTSFTPYGPTGYGGGSAGGFNGFNVTSNPPGTQDGGAGCMIIKEYY
jgi:hypothetical protein